MKRAKQAQNETKKVSKMLTKAEAVYAPELQLKPKTWTIFMHLFAWQKCMKIFQILGFSLSFGAGTALALQ